MQKKNNSKLILINLIIVGSVLLTFYFLGKNEILTVNTVALNVRTGPGVTYEIQAQAKKGEKIKVLNKENGWYEAEFEDGSKGWVASWLVENKNSSANTNVQATVNTEGVKMREDANTESTIIETLSEGTKVNVVSEQNGWSRVTSGRKKGWINSTLLDVGARNKEDEESDAPKILYAREANTNVRADASIEGEVVTKMALGDTATILNTSGDWYQIQTSDGKKGYVANWVVGLGKPDAGDNATPISNIAEATIMIDPGHGGEDVGAETRGGVYEKAVTLSTGLYLQKELEKKGANVIMSREKDTFIPLRSITDMSNTQKPDVFISIHYDSSDDPNSASGTTTYYYYDRDKRLAETINKHLEKELPLPNRGFEYNDLHVTRENTQPALLLELGYLNNDNDATYAVSKKYQKKAATAITNGLEEYFRN